MIVKDEAHVIERCLNSLKCYIDYWVIVDTGSTDRTKEIIQKMLQGVPGELHEAVWVDFSHARNLALNLAKGKGEYLFFIDADELFLPEKDFSWEQLHTDCAFCRFYLENESIIQRIALVRADLEWVWEGAIHEEIRTKVERTGEVLKKAMIRAIQDGRRSKDPDKHRKDIKTLQNESLKNPESSRPYFYLGITHELVDEPEEALKAYRRRSQMSGWPQEIFYSLYRIAILEEQLNKSPIHSFCKAYAYRPRRVEPLYRLGEYFLKQNLPFITYLLASFAMKFEMPDDRSFVETDVYQYLLAVQKANAATYLRRVDETFTYLQLALSADNLPAKMRSDIQRALNYLKTRKAIHQERIG